MSLLAIYVMVQLLLQPLAVFFIQIWIMLKEFFNMLCSFDQHLSYQAGLYAEILHHLQRQAFTVELLQPNLPIELVRAEDEVPVLQRSPSGCFGLRLHMICVDLCCVYWELGLILLVNGYDLGPLIH